MSKKDGHMDKIYDALLSETTRQRGEKVIVTISIVSFLIHVILIWLVDMELISFGRDIGLFNDPIAAIYTPFSFILIYEVYLLVYNLPRSTSFYIGKQYEIITLIVVRRIFKDLSYLDFDANWFQDKSDLQFTYDIITTLVLFLLIFFYHRLNKKELSPERELTKNTLRLIRRKKWIAIVLVPVFLGMAVYSLSIWSYDALTSSESNYIATDLNQIFFGEFFTILILADVLLLLFSLFLTDRFSHVIRNSGFIISTILIRMSFGTDGLINNLLIIVAVLFGVLLLMIFNQYKKLELH